MKLSNPFRLLTVLCFCLFSTGIQAQEEHVITLEVNTAAIENPNVNDFCRFQGQEPEVSNEEYTIEARIGDTVIWRGISTSSPDDVVEIRAINHQGDRGGRDIFGQNQLQGENGQVIGTIVNTTEEGTEYKYMLQFRVYNNGTRRGGTFNIDPRIRVVGQ
ncbi:hypothetical protein [Robiginitalea marina]|uniref:Uncharacterized protein n=1 Tax=Robiginitalea marina TaxID=2954105 RepID=A0ABT1AVH3_9FLAO|nr:hypothetical protein [Robiginitalea marina]MCO5724051.1 hypothetical protein [Robiginitalea marina]